MDRSRDEEKGRGGEEMKAVVFTLGCKVNSCESESLMAGLKAKGYETSEELCAADLYVINTCAVTAEAEKKSRQTIARARKFNENAKIIVTGCASQKVPEDFLKKKGVTLVTGAKSKDKILAMLDETGVAIEKSDEYYEEFLPEKTDRTRAFIKVEDGCDNFCSYCIIPYLRGRVRSRNPENAVREIECLSPLEAVITGINLSSYNYNNLGFKELIDRLSGVDCRIRLGSLEANVITEDFLSSLKKLKDFAPHFHLSLQSGSDDVLKAMNRHYTVSEYLAKCELIRKFFPSAAITTDIIVGYSAESDVNFGESLETARKAKFADIHCFPYSRREGTAGAKLKEIPHEIKAERMERMLALKRELKEKFIAENVGETRELVPEEIEDGYLVGYTENYVRCYVRSDFVREKIKVRLTGPFKDGALAEIME